MRLRLIENHDKFLVLISVSNPPTAIPGILLTTETGIDMYGSKGDDDELSSSNSVQILDKSKFMIQASGFGISFCIQILIDSRWFPDSKYLSNLNDINKSEQKSNADISKGLGWPTADGEAGLGEF